jgi:hypothetical protein
MARQTYTELQNTTKDFISASSGSLASSTIANFIKEHVNKSYHNIQSELRSYITQEENTVLTVASQQYYQYPEDVYPPIEAATWTIASVAYPLQVVDSQKKWHQINEIDFSGTTVPQFIFPRRDDFGLYPIPSTASETVTLVSSLADRDMTQEDYTTGTVTVANGDATVTGAGTTFTAAMVGRWFQATTDAFWYRISSFTSATAIELERNFGGTDGATLAYTIGETPELPPEVHYLIPHGAAAMFFTVRKDFDAAQSHLNFLKYGTYTPTADDVRLPRGGLMGAIKRYAKRDNSALVYHKKEAVNRFDERFTATISSTI